MTAIILSAIEIELPSKIVESYQIRKKHQAKMLELLGKLLCEIYGNMAIPVRQLFSESGLCFYPH
jgi:hypothetical protein